MAEVTQMKEHGSHPSHGHGHAANHYVRLAWMAILSFIAMYVLMYAMVDRRDNVYLSLGQLYMAALMAAPMVVIELALMGDMYEKKRLNLALIAGSLVAAITFWAAIRTEAGVGNAQFVRSMIPHHAGAIQMCNESAITDAELRSLCQSIIRGQQQEIDQMKAILARLERS